MDIGKSMRVAMAMRGLRNNQLAEKMGVTQATISVMLSRRTCTGQALIQLCEIFDMKASEFLRLGED